MKKIFVFTMILLLFSANAFAKSYTEEIYEIYYRIVDEENKIYGGEYITREEFASVLAESMGYLNEDYRCSFYDVYESDISYGHIAALQNLGIAAGDGDNNFNPDDDLTVRDAVVFLSRTYGIDKFMLGSYSEQEVSGVSEYAKDFVGFAVGEGIYPKNSNDFKGADKRITAKEALNLMNDYRESFNKGFRTPMFVSGYPEMQNSGKSGSLLVGLKTDRACNVYYMIRSGSESGNDYIPPQDNVDMFLTAIAKADTKISVNIGAEQKNHYDIFFVLEGEDGIKSGVYSMKNISVLPFTMGNGTKNNPYRIYSAYQFEQIRNYPDKCFLLSADIEYNKEWIPIGSMRNEKNFSGVLDGGGYSITGITVDVLNNAGIFAELDGATVKNLYVDANVSGGSCVGIIAGISNKATITDCHVSGTVEASENIAGGIVGKNSGKIENCLSLVYFVTSKAYAGGICGTNSGSVKNCFSGVERVNSGMYASSVAGVNTGGIIQNCVGASMEINNELPLKNGRITANKENGTTVNNYCYADMISEQTVYFGENLPDGAEVSWNDITTQEFYKKKLGWEFFDKWTFKMYPSITVPTLKNVSSPKLIEGLTVYAPKKITNGKELAAIGKNPSGHYYLANDIYLEYDNPNQRVWSPIGVSDEYGNLYNSFSGTFDGMGHTISNIKLSYKIGELQCGLFGVLYGGTIRNLKVSNASGTVRGSVGVIVGVNYGLIENCEVSGTLNIYDRNSETVVGGICGINYTNIISCNSKINISADAESSSLGGICGSNEGYIYDCRHSGKISSISTSKSSNVVAGGICGSNYSGFVYNSYAYNDMSSNSNTSYLGGIVGLMNYGEIYKCSTDGKIYSKAERKNNSSVYLGGNAGLVSGGIVMNSFSKSTLLANAEKVYVGGVSGFCENGSIQNVYSANEISARNESRADGGVYVGGIVGYSDNSYIMSSAAINPKIDTVGLLGEICGYEKDGFSGGNYFYDGTKESLFKFKNTEFFFAPVDEGGLMGWNSDAYGGDVWTKSKNKNYPFPVLYGVKNQDDFYFEM